MTTNSQDSLHSSKDANQVSNCCGSEKPELPTDLCGDCHEHCEWVEEDDSNSPEIPDSSSTPPSDTEEVESLLAMLEHWIEPPAVTGSLEPDQTKDLVAYIRSLQSQNAELRKAVEVTKGALSILQKNVVRAIRRAERGLRTKANPLIDLEEVLKALPSLETLIGVVPLCDRCGKPAFKNHSEFCDSVLCKTCADIPPQLGEVSPSQS